MNENIFGIILIVGMLLPFLILWLIPAKRSLCCYCKFAWQLKSYHEWDTDDMHINCKKKLNVFYHKRKSNDYCESFIDRKSK